MPFNIKLPVQTRGGKKARIICTDIKGKQNIAAAVEFEPYKEMVRLFYNTGIWSNGHENVTEHDLVNVEEPDLMKEEENASKTD